jgi:hypothetical protein
VADNVGGGGTVCGAVVVVYVVGLAVTRAAAAAGVFAARTGREAVVGAVAGGWKISWDSSDAAGVAVGRGLAVGTAPELPAGTVAPDPWMRLRRSNVCDAGCDVGCDAKSAFDELSNAELSPAVLSSEMRDVLNFFCEQANNSKCGATQLRRPHNIFLLSMLELISLKSTPDGEVTRRQ